MKINREAEDKLLFQKVTKERITQPKVQWEPEEEKHEPEYLCDGSWVDSAVQAAFSTIDVDDS